MGKPHVLINICFVDPERRHEGVGNRMLRWGLNKADEMNLETWVESSQNGRDFYKANGFLHVEDEILDPVVAESDGPKLADVKEIWYKKRLLLFMIDIMKRPTRENDD
ncbi:hypothetical protein M7I_1439 [Glarea lozoyensis 74030]|uniref:N-acetyltransferase domain-containing protein n=1 Tax=Glarea lozoyensis (strain ATCC 74030 / MF5533) TaxID=1104152 RepID=H0EG31_GLAL7|nr:hypothetical protein M7I_1439 [Glarea lozoyensis 74030]